MQNNTNWMNVQNYANSTNVKNYVNWRMSKTMLTPWMSKTMLIGSLKCASCSNWKVYIPKSYSFWVPLEVYIKRKSKIQCFGPVLSSWWFSIHLLELKIQLLWIPPCHTSKVASWHVDCRYDLHFWCYLGKILSKSLKTCKKWWFEQQCQISPVFGLLLNILPS